MRGIKTSARNLLPGTVKKITPGAVNTEVTLDVGGQEIVSIITNESVKSLGLAVGGNAYAMIKASHVIVAVDA